MKLILIKCCTGCSCCSWEDHYRGPYRSIEDAKKRIAYFRSPDNVKYWPVASQYSKRGNYLVEEIEYEEISNNRCIIFGDKVISLRKPIELLKDGSLKDEESDYLFTIG